MTPSNSPGSGSLPEPGEAAGAPGLSAEQPARTVRVRIVGGDPRGDDPVAVASSHAGVSAARMDGDTLVAQVGPPADLATLAGFLADHGFQVAG